jgi:hypothetical protein
MVHEEAHLLFSSVFAEHLQGELYLTVLATGSDAPEQAHD